MVKKRVESILKEISDTDREFKEIVRREFSYRLKTKMLEKGWNQSELARQAGAFMPSGSLGRDSVSGYIRGRFIPGPDALNALAKALDVESSDLLTSEVVSTQIDEASLTLTLADKGKVLLKINGYVKLRTAAKIMEILADDQEG